MLNWLKNHFIPCSENNHHPNFFSNGNTFAIVVLLICFEMAFFITPHFVIKNQPAAVIVAVLDDLTNKERSQNNLSVLKENPLLAKAAELKAQDMVKKGYFAHTSPEGLTPWHWLDEVGYEYNYAGENLAVNFFDTQDVTGAWMKSITHKANIVKANYTEMGSGIATGTYKGIETVFAVQVYASPAEAPIVIKGKAPIVVAGSSLEANKLVSSTVARQATGTVLGATIEPDVLIVESQTLTDDIPTTTIENIKNHQSSYFNKLFSSPRHTTNYALITILCFVFLAMLLNIFVKVKIQNFNAIVNGLIILVIIGIIIFVNIGLSDSQVDIKSGIDYVKNQTI